MKQYEYKFEAVTDLAGPAGTLNGALKGMNKLGAEGWRFVAIMGDKVAVFAREVPPAIPESVAVGMASCATCGKHGQVGTMYDHCHPPTTEGDPYCHGCAAVGCPPSGPGHLPNPETGRYDCHKVTH